MAKAVSKVICAVLGAVLGSSAGCGVDVEYGMPAPEYGMQPAEYGMPHARYVLDGSVVNAADSQPIEGIEVSLGGHSALSDADGLWELDADGVFPCNDDCKLEARDIDGVDNGAFDNRVVAFEPTKTAEGASGWDDGIFEQSDISIELDEQ